MKWYVVAVDIVVALVAVMAIALVLDGALWIAVSLVEGATR